MTCTTTQKLEGIALEIRNVVMLVVPIVQYRMNTVLIGGCFVALKTKPFVLVKKQFILENI